MISDGAFFLFASIAMAKSESGQRAIVGGFAALPIHFGKAAKIRFRDFG